LAIDLEGCDRGLAEEIADDAFFAAGRKWSQIRDYDQPAGYVFTIARHKHFEQRGRHDQRAEIMEVGIGSVKAYASRGRKKLRILLADFGPGYEGDDDDCE
jgi:DNA-directed RNA polymerase specialized sigma24 family protein